MEMILGVIEDLIEKVAKGSEDEKEDAKMELNLNKLQFQTQLGELAQTGNAKAQELLNRLKTL